MYSWIFSPNICNKVIYTLDYTYVWFIYNNKDDIANNIIRRIYEARITILIVCQRIQNIGITNIYQVMNSVTGRGIDDPWRECDRPELAVQSKQMQELSLDLAAGPGLRRLLGSLLDGQEVRRRRRADVGQQGAAAQQQELEQQASLGERSCERLKELALVTCVKNEEREIRSPRKQQKIKVQFAYVR